MTKTEGVVSLSFWKLRIASSRFLAVVDPQLQGLSKDNHSEGWLRKSQLAQVSHQRVDLGEICALGWINLLHAKGQASL